MRVFQNRSVEGADRRVLDPELPVDGHAEPGEESPDLGVFLVVDRAGLVPEDPFPEQCRELLDLGPSEPVRQCHLVKVIGQAVEGLFGREAEVTADQHQVCDVSASELRRHEIQLPGERISTVLVSRSRFQSMREIFFIAA